ncbi:hypothetical protein Trydic_g23274 [Trypoxylus dichotomus]
MSKIHTNPPANFFILFLILGSSLPILGTYRGKSELTSDDRKFLKELPRKEREITDRLLAAFEKFVRKEKEMQSAAWMLQGQELKNLRKDLVANKNFQKFIELMYGYDTIYQYIFEKDPLAQLSDVVEEHKGVKPSMKSFFLSDEYLDAERQFIVLAREAAKRLKHNLRMDDENVMAFDQLLSKLLSAKVSLNVMKYLENLGVDCQRYAHFTAGDYVIKRTLVEEGLLE